MREMGKKKKIQPFCTFICPFRAGRARSPSASSKGSFFLKEHMSPWGRGLPQAPRMTTERDMGVSWTVEEGEGP